MIKRKDYGIDFYVFGRYLFTWGRAGYIANRTFAIEWGRLLAVAWRGRVLYRRDYD